jgi:hypothetical protein
MSWGEAEDAVRTNKLEVLGRSVVVQEAYNEFRMVLQTKWSSLGEYIFVSKFKCAEIPNSEDPSKLCADKSSLRGSMDAPIYHLCENDFPYYYEDDVRHLIFWKTTYPEVSAEPVAWNEEFSTKEIEEGREKVAHALAAEGAAEGRGRSCVEIIHYVNPPHLKSIEAIAHVHYLARLA